MPKRSMKDIGQMRKSLEGQAYAKKLKRIKESKDYIRNLINARFLLARCNMLADQLINKKIVESIDGCLKTEEYVRAEYALTKMQAMNSMRDAHFQKKDLMEDYSMTEEDILLLEKDYYDGKVIRESYDEEYRKEGKAKFVDSPAD